LATAGANLLMEGSFEYPRFIVGYPAIAMTIGAGICYVLPMLLYWLPNRKGVLAVTVVIVAVICIVQVNYYFNEHVPVLRQQVRNWNPFPDTVDAALRAANFPAGTQVYLIADVIPDRNIPKDILSLYRWNKPLPQVRVDTLYSNQVTDVFLKSLTVDKDYAFFIPIDHEALLNQIRSVFVLDAPQFTAQNDIVPEKMFLLYYAPLRKQK
jgi:hypothetical protein